VRDDNPTAPKNPESANHKANQAGQRQDNDWESFDFESWGTAMEDPPGANALPLTDERTGHGTAPQLEEGEPEGAGWVSHGGILYWDEPGDQDLEESSDVRREAHSRWADDSIDLPPGAPDHLRTRSLRAWLLRQRLLETEAIGQLLLERRQSEVHLEDDQDSYSASEPAEDSPLELELIKRQASIEVYEALVESLDEMATHSGPARLLVEFYLWLTERLALLASAPQAPSDFAVRARIAPQDPLDNPSDSPETGQPGSPPPTARSIAQWQGQAQAALQARRRIEHVSAPEPED
jgi:hypothetical protein